MESRLSLRKVAFTLSLALAVGLVAPLLAEAAEAQNSVYQLNGKWKNAEGKEISLGEEFRGNPVVVTMAYTKCTYTCPLIVKKLKEIESALGKNPKVRFLLISFDTKNETPETMAAFMKEKDLDPTRWKMVTGKTSGSVREMAALLEINYKEEANGHFSHSNVISLLDKEGVIRASLKGIAADHAPLVKEAKNSL
jgi:protein SCO1/2